MREGDSRQLKKEMEEEVAHAMHCALSGEAGHWPTVAVILREEILRLRRDLESETSQRGYPGSEPTYGTDSYFWH